MGIELITSAVLCFRESNGISAFLSVSHVFGSHVVSHVNNIRQAIPKNLSRHTHCVSVQIS